MSIFKILLFLLFLSLLCGIISNTIHHNFNKYMSDVDISYNKHQRQSIKQLLVQTKGNVSNFFRNMDTILLIDSTLKFKFSLYIFSVIYILFLIDLPLIMTHLKILNFIIIVIFLIGVGEFIHTNVIEGSLILNIGFLIIKYGVFLIYPISLASIFIEKVDIKLLLLCTIVLLTYSFLFLKNIIDTFKSYLFQFFSFVAILICFNLFFIGLTFGIFYFENNEDFNFFNENEVTKIQENLSFSNMIIIAIKGIEPFFNFKFDNSYSLNGIGYVPVLENMVGTIYLLLIVGFFVSYSTGTLIDRKSQKKKK